jgi:hypothetical protein
MKNLNNKKGFSLLAVLVPLLVLTTLIGVMSTDMLSFMKSSQVSSSSGTIDQTRDSLLWALRAEYYQEVMRVRSNASPADRIFTAANLNTIVDNALFTLGQPQGTANNAEFTFSSTGAGTIKGRIELSLPVDIDTTKAKPTLDLVTDTNTWLDGTLASLHTLKCKITLYGTTSNGFSLPQNTTYHYLIFAQIPASQLALSALGNLKIDDAAIKNSVSVDSSVYVADALSGGSDLDLGSNSNQKIAAGNLSSTAIRKNGSNVNAGADSRFNYEFDKLASDQKAYASNLDKQRDVGLSTPIKPEYMFREGLADDLMDSTVFPSSMTVSQKNNLRQMLVAHQPYYQVPVTARFFGNYNVFGAPGAQYSPIASSTPTDPVYGRGASLPAFIEIEKRSDKDYVQANVYVDEMPLVAGTNDLYLFLGAKDIGKPASDPTAFDKFKIILKRRNDTVIDSYIEKPDLKRVTIVSPNDIVMGGNIRFRDSNSPNKVATATVYAREVFFGTSQLNKVDYSGSVAQLNTQATTKSLDFKSVDNFAATSTNIAFKKSTDVSENKGADLYYYQVLMQNKDKTNF